MTQNFLTDGKKKNDASGFTGALVPCFHCQLPAFEGSTFYQEDKAFCCRGCLSVYNVLKGAGLDEFYRLDPRDNTGKRLESYNANLGFHHFDRGDEREKIFYLEGVHCLACLWLIETIGKKIEGVESIRLNMSTSQAVVTLGETGRFSEVAQWLNKIGYFPHLISDPEEGAKLHKKENHQMLKRIGVAGFSAGNIMLLAISIYGGAEGRFFEIFTWLSAILFIPAVTYSAYPFYQSAYKKILSRQLSIDIPVAVLIILGSVASYFKAWKGSDSFYFDSLSVFILLLLSARYFLKRIQQQHSTNQRVQDIFESSEIQKKVGNSFESVSVDELKVGDVFLVRNKETIPLDSKVLSGAAYLNTALLTGEHFPQRIESGATALAGSVLLSGELHCEVTHDLSHSQLGKILHSIEDSWKNSGEEAQLADKLATALLLFAFVLSGLTFAYFFKLGDWEEGMQRAMAILIVTCPCALGLGTPLAYIRGLKELFKQRIVVKNGNTLQQISDVKNVFLDKTGTLTQGNIAVTEVFEELKRTDAEKIWALENLSLHPIAKAICNYLEATFTLRKNSKLEGYTEELGVGVHAIIDGKTWKAEKSKDDKFSVSIFCDDQHVASFLLKDQVQEKSLNTLKWLKTKGIQTYIVTGDKRSHAEDIGRKLELPAERIFADELPEDKARHIRESEKAMMIGDGYNDVIAFGEASVGVALGQKVDLKLKNADVFIPSGNIDDVVRLFEEAHITRKTLKRNVGLSVAYNIVGIGGSVLGYINPLTAAILMPLSSVSVLLSSIWRRKKNL